MIYKINGKEYESKDFDFGALAKLEECGVTMTDLQNVKNKPMTLILGLVAWVIDCSKEDAIEEINEHIKNGGTLKDLMKIFDSLKNSDFFIKAMKQ